MDPVAILNRNVLFPAWVRKNRSARLAYVREFERTQFLSTDELRDMQWRQLKALLRHAYIQCEFYRVRFRASGLEPDDIKTEEDFARIPLLTKRDIQESRDLLIADDVDRTQLVRDMTGGSTGSPMVFFYDEDRRDSRAAATIRHNRWTGWNIGDKMAVLWGAPRDLAGPPSIKGRVRDWIIDRRVLLDASALSPERMRSFHAALVRSRAQYMLAYANTLGLFARFLRAEGLKAPRLRAIISSAELLTSESRQLVESMFGCQVFDRYGSREFAVIASECAAHSGMHVNAESLLVETRLNQTSAGQVGGEIVVTDLKNHVMPMIRYRTMDVGHLRPSSCACGRHLPLLDLTGGRTTDFLWAAHGGQVSGIVLATYVITGIVGVRQVQFVQRRRGSVTVRIARGGEWSADTLNSLNTRIHEYLGETTEIAYEFVDEILPEASGKFRFSICAIGD